jgi:hypothetical protein
LATLHEEEERLIADTFWIFYRAECLLPFFLTLFGCTEACTVVSTIRVTPYRVGVLFLNPNNAVGCFPGQAYLPLPGLDPYVHYVVTSRF